MYSYSTQEGDKYPDIILCNSVQHDKAKLAQSDNWAFLPDLDQDVFDNLGQRIFLELTKILIIELSYSDVINQKDYKMMVKINYNFVVNQNSFT